ncbi:hypothetical protein U9M48_013987 [Paspalum notatum var. saurae]|uniref:Fatty acyl-CoA reductase n=1 Tax=Paspalum notatum var. saurae TaxID=547442 RepID=A0AAQ3WK43_PASNO
MKAGHSRDPAMESSTVAGSFFNRTILVTGSTGFLGKLLVEKILRVQPNVKRLYLLVRAPDDAAAEQRVLDEVVGNELFDVLRGKYGTGFDSFIKEKISPIAGDIIHVNFGIDNARIKHLFQEINIIINGAATTNFYERYDVALASNTFGIAHVCHFAKQCVKLKMLLHVSTAYVTGEQEGLLLEQPLQMGKALKRECYLDIEAELELANDMKEKHMTMCSGIETSKWLEKEAMKELGMKRAKYFGWPNTYVFTKAMGEMLLGCLREDVPVIILRPSIITSTFEDPFPGWIQGIRTNDILIVAYHEQKLPCFIGKGILDAIPGDMVVSAMMVAMATHYGDVGTQIVYNVTSGLKNPLSCQTLMESTYGYLINPRVTDEGRTIKHKRLLLFSRYAYFYAYMIVKYKIPLQMLFLVNLLCGGFFSEYYNKLNRSFNHLMLVANFDDKNLRNLWRATRVIHGDEYLFNFDPNCFSWKSYLVNTHIPAVLKFAQKKKGGRA